MNVLKLFQTNVKKKKFKEEEIKTTIALKQSLEEQSTTSELVEHYH